MEPALIGIGILCLLAGVGGSLKVGIGAITIGGTIGGVLVVLGFLL